MKQVRLDERAREILIRNDRGGYTVPNGRVYPFQWNWDSAFVSLGFAAMDLDRAHMIARRRGPIMPVYWIARAILQPFFLVYFRLNRIGKDQIPSGGPVLIASNHRSFLDPFVIATMARYGWRWADHIVDDLIFRRDKI